MTCKVPHPIWRANERCKSWKLKRIQNGCLMFKSKFRSYWRTWKLRRRFLVIWRRPSSNCDVRAAHETLRLAAAYTTILFLISCVWRITIGSQKATRNFTLAASRQQALEQRARAHRRLHCFSNKYRCTFCAKKSICKLHRLYVFRMMPQAAKAGDGDKAAAGSARACRRVVEITATLTWTRARGGRAAASNRAIA